MMQAAAATLVDAPNVAVELVIKELGVRLSAKAKVITEEGEEWGALMQRWTDIGKENPGAIVCVAEEDDVVETVKFCLAHKIRFVPKAGGHSAWSTIGKDGVIIDLSAFNGVEVDSEAKTVTIQGGAQNKAVLATLFEAGLCCAFGSANTVGTVPQAINGGLSALSGVLGHSSDVIVSARLITSTGELITVSKTSHPELLYAIKGAGQYFGLVTSLTMQAAPLSALGSEDGTLWSTKAIFPASRIAELVGVFAKLVNDPNPRAAGLVVVTKDPMGSGKTIVLCVLWYMGNTEESLSQFGELKEMEPSMWGEKRVPYGSINDDFDSLCIKGGYKRFYLAGLPRFQSDVTVWEKNVEIFDAMIEKCGSEAGHSGIAFEWTGKGEPGRFEESAFGHRDVRCWIECLSWYKDIASSENIDSWEKNSIEVGTAGFKENEIRTYQNFSRFTTLESRFPGVDRQNKLKALKKEWDSEGVFTRVFL